MTRIEKAVKIASDLYDFYRRIPKIPGKKASGEEENTPVKPAAPEGMLRSPKSRLTRRR